MTNPHSIEIRPYTRCTYTTDHAGTVCNRRVAGWAADEDGAVIVTACADHADESTTQLAAMLGMVIGEELDRRVDALLAKEATR